MEYTSDGRQVKSVTDSRGNQTGYTYDSGNRLLTRVTDARGNATNYTYDANTDKLTKVSRTVGGQDVSVDYAYEKDRLTSITRNGVTFHYGYDAYGNQTSVAVGSNVLEQTAYRNKNGLADRMTFATGESIRNEYDSKEQLIAQYLVKADGTEEKLFTNTYDHYGNVVRHEDHRGDKVTGYQYDFIGRLLGEDASDGFRIRTAYDDKNRVKSYLYRADGKGNKTEFVYGDPAKQQKPGLGYGVLVNGEECIRYTYDALGRHTKKTRKLSDTKSVDTEYTYVQGKEKGLTTSLVESVKEGNKTLYYSYDAAGNITEIWEQGTAGGSKVRKVKYYYDELDQLIREDNKWQNLTIVYAYDIGGNLKSRKTYAYTTAATISGTVKSTDTYTYGNSAWKDQLTAYKGQTITYDAMGNPLSYRGKTMEWEQGRRLKKITGTNLTQTNSYDNDGIRTKKVVNGVTTEFYTSGSAILAQKSSDGTRLDFLYDDKGNLFAMEYAGERYFYQKNLQGDITGLIDSTGTEVVTYTYDTWGKLLSKTDGSGNGLAEKNPFRYRGYYYDAEVSLYYVSSRYYDPEVRRFISIDVTSVLTASNLVLTDKNLYVYCDNNPIVRKDGAGTVWETVFDVVSLGFSIAEVAANPYDVGAWVGLVGDTIDLIPIVTGVGETVRGIRFVDKAGDTLEIAKATDFTADAKKTINSLKRTNGFTKSNRRDGMKIHEGYKTGKRFSKKYKEYRKVKGIRPDYYSTKARKIYELKPYNPRAAKAGIKQLRKYNKILGGKNIMRLEFY